MILTNISKLVIFCFVILGLSACAAQIANLVDVHAINKDGETFLVGIASNEEIGAEYQLEGIERTLQRGADPNAKNIKHGGNALSGAAYIMRNKLVKRLIQAGADVNIKRNDGMTPLMLTCTRNIIMKKNPNLEPYYIFETFKDGFKEDPHMIDETVRILISAGADVNAISNYGDTALSNCSKYGHTEAVRLLKEAGAIEATMAENPAIIIRRIQKKLTDLKYEPGDINGLMGPETAAAIRDYQSVVNLTQDGKATKELLSMLNQPCQVQIINSKPTKPQGGCQKP